MSLIESILRRLDSQSEYIDNLEERIQLLEDSLVEAGIPLQDPQ